MAAIGSYGGIAEIRCFANLIAMIRHMPRKGYVSEWAQ